MAVVKISRMDLDLVPPNPLAVVQAILKAAPDLPTPTPIEELAAALDITEFQELQSEGFEGGLITTPERTAGIILFNAASPTPRKRFTIGHELGHFLIGTHKPPNGRQFLCRLDDMAAWDMKTANAFQRMEAEANQFSSLILMPPPRLRDFFRARRDPDLGHVAEMAERFAVSKEAAGRKYIEFHDAALALIILHQGVVVRCYKNKKFPWLSVEQGKLGPRNSSFLGPRAKQSPDMLSCPYGTWTQRDDVEVLEQCAGSPSGWQTILLWMPGDADDDEFDPEENMTAAQRQKHRDERWGR